MYVYKSLVKTKLICCYLAVLMITPMFAFAQDKLLRNSEIVGLSLNNNRTEIKQILEKEYAITGFSEFKNKFNLNNVETGEISQCYLFELAEKTSDQANSKVSVVTSTDMENKPIEFIAISLDPEENSQSIISIHRDVTFEKGKELVKNVFLKSIYEKYGKANIANDANSELYIWSDPPINWQTSHGYLVNFAHDIAYSIPVASNYTDRNCSERFIGAVSWLNMNKANLSTYKTILLLQLRTDRSQRDQVSGFTLTIVDLSKGISSLNKLLDSTRNKANQSKEAILKQKEQNSGPKL